MASPNFSLHFEERVDLTFRAPTETLRSLVRQSSRKIEEFSLGRGRGTAFTLDESAIYVLGSRVLVQTGESRRAQRRALEIAAAIVLTVGVDKLTRFVYQQRAFDHFDAEEFRASIQQARTLLGSALGAAVVSGATAHFHPNLAKTKSPTAKLESADYSIQLLMEGFGAKFESALRSKGLTPAAALSQLLERLKVIKAGEWRTVALGPNEDTLVSVTETCVQQLRISMRAPALISFVADGRSNFAASNKALVEIISALEPGRHRLEILHSASAKTPSLPGEWDQHGLGRDRIRSVHFTTPKRFANVENEEPTVDENRRSS